MVIKTIAKDDGIIEVQSAYEAVSHEQMLAEITAVIEDVVVHLIKKDRKSGNLQTRPEQYYNTIAGILSEIAKSE